MPRTLLTLGAVLLAGFGVWLVVGLVGGTDSGSGALPTVAVDAPPVRLHWNGDPVATVEPEEVDGSVPIVERLPSEAADPRTWRLLAVVGEAGRRMAVAHPAARYGDQQACLYLLEGRLALGYVATRGGAPSTYLARVTDVFVWTTEPVPEPIRVAEAGLTVVVDGGPPVRPSAQQLSGLAVVLPPEGSGHPGWPLRAVVALAVDPARVARVEVLVGEAAGAEASGPLLRSERAALLLRPNRRGALAFDGFGVDEAGLPLDLRVRGVTRLVVTTGAAIDAPSPQVEPRIEPSLAEREAARKALAAQREAVRAATARHPDAAARETLIGYLEHEHPRVRADAVQALQRWDDASEVLFAHLERERDDHVRAIVFHALGRIAPAAYMARLVPYVGVVKTDIDKDAAKAIKRIARRTGEPVPEGLPDWATRVGRRGR